MSSIWLERNPPARVVAIAAHPDDAEAGCGGTLAQFADAGADVVILYLTRGEAGTRYLPAGSPASNDLGAARVREAERACRFLGVRPAFWDQPDGRLATSAVEQQRFCELISLHDPDLVLTHWPVDSHPDHRGAATLARQAWVDFGRRFQLAYYEVMPGVQTMDFQPDWYVDISQSWKRKRYACQAHHTQCPRRFRDFHAELELRRGAEAAITRAEAFRFA